MTVYHGGKVHVHAGDCLAVMAGLEASSFDACVTDPPYELGFMGRAWDRTQIAHKPETWAAVLRVLKPGAHLVAFGAPKNWHRLTCAIEDAGFEIRDNLLYLFGSGFPKSHNIGNGFGTALKPAYEPIVLARKPLVGTVAANVMAHGTGALNIDACRVETDEPRPCLERRKDAGLDASRNTYGTGINGSRAIEPTTLGRWPANLVHDGSPEVVEGFPESNLGNPRTIKGKESIGYGGSDVEFQTQFHGGAGSAARFFATFPQDEPRGRQPGGFGNVGAANGGSVPNGPQYRDSGSVSRYFYTAKADSDDRLGSKHPTVKPLDLIQWLVRLITPPRGHILDPFAGTGTTAEAALREGFRCSLIEREAEYLADIERRMALAFDGDVGRSVAMAKLKPEPEPLPLFAPVWQRIVDRHDDKPWGSEEAHQNGVGCYEDWMAEKRKALG